MQFFLVIFRCFRRDVQLKLDFLDIHREYLSLEEKLKKLNSFPLAIIIAEYHGEMPPIGYSRFYLPRKNLKYGLACLKRKDLKQDWAVPKIKLKDDKLHQYIVVLLKSKTTKQRQSPCTNCALC